VSMGVTHRLELKGQGREPTALGEFLAKILACQAQVLGGGGLEGRVKES
jgi:hypothetical protein